MEEKERYIIDKSTNYYTNTIVDTKINTYYGNVEEHIDLLNKQNKENQQLKQQLAESKEENKKLVKALNGDIFINYKVPMENAKLKQQLHDLPKKIVEDIEKNFTEYLPLKYKTGAGFYSRLNTILKKYGGENE